MQVYPQTEVKQLLLLRTIEMWKNLEEILMSSVLAKKKEKHKNEVDLKRFLT